MAFGGEWWLTSISDVPSPSLPSAIRLLPESLLESVSLNCANPLIWFVKQSSMHEEKGEVAEDIFASDGACGGGGDIAN
jgi:hypothetical protein